MARLLTCDVNSSGLCTVHKDDGTSTEYANWATMEAAETVSSIETLVVQDAKLSVGAEGGGTFRFSGGVAPLTARPSQGATERASGQGCKACTYKSSCVSLAGRRVELTNRNGIKCGSFVAG